MEVVKDEYKIYDSDSKDICIKDSEFVENWRVLGVVSPYFCRPFTKQELKLADLLDLITISERKHFSDFVPWSLDVISLVCYWNHTYINLMTLLIDIFVSHPKVYNIKGDILTVYLQEQIVIFKIKDRTKFELLRTKLVVFYKSVI
jgi:hypothetical protein